MWSRFFWCANGEQCWQWWSKHPEIPESTRVSTLSMTLVICFLFSCLVFCKPLLFITWAIESDTWIVGCWHSQSLLCSTWILYLKLVLQDSEGMVYSSTSGCAGAFKLLRLSACRWKCNDGFKSNSRFLVFPYSSIIYNLHWGSGQYYLFHIF